MFSPLGVSCNLSLDWCPMMPPRSTMTSEIVVLGNMRFFKSSIGIVVCLCIFSLEIEWALPPPLVIVRIHFSNLVDLGDGCFARCNKACQTPSPSSIIPPSFTPWLPASFSSIDSVNILSSAFFALHPPTLPIRTAQTVGSLFDPHPGPTSGSEF